MPADLSSTSFLVPARYCGPPHSGNGGWVSGHVAALLEAERGDDQAVTVRLSSPPPLDRPMRVERETGTVRVLDGDVLVGTGRLGALPTTADLPEALTRGEANAALAAFDLEAARAFATCYVCGCARVEGEALRLFTGPVPGRDGVVAAPWTPQLAPGADGALEDVWAALDCPGAWAMHFDETPMVLGELTLTILRMPEAGVEHVVAGWARDVQGRKHRCGTALWTADGELLAHADATWIAIDPDAIRPA